MVQAQKRRNRRVIVVSEDEDEEDGSNIAQRKNGIRDVQQNIGKHAPSTSDNSLPTQSRKRSESPQSSQTTTSSATHTSTSTPRKPQRRTKPTEVKKTGAKTLYSFFNVATQRQQRPSTSPQKESAEKENECDDVIDDNSSAAEEQFDSVPSLNKASFVIPKKRPRDYWETQRAGAQSSSTTSVSGARRKIFKTSNGHKAVVTPDYGGGNPKKDLAWMEQYAPVSLEELGVHKKKVADVRQWFEDVFDGRTVKRLLVLKGIAGTGKTMTISLLSQTLGFQLVEWRNPAVSDFMSHDYVSVSAQFEDFMGRTSNFGGLDLVGPNRESITMEPSEHAPGENKRTRHATIIEEFPYTLMGSTTAVQLFRSTILQYLAANTHARVSTVLKNSESSSVAAPLVIIISESVLSNATNSFDSFTAHRLLGHEILNHSRTTTIEFNPVAPTILSKAMNLILQKHNYSSNLRCSLDSIVIQKLSESGDLRNATSTLEFLCSQANPNDVSNVPVRITTTKSKPRPPKTKSVSQTSMPDLATTTALSLITLRESSLGIFHAIGKVVYNKRSEPPLSFSSTPAEFTPIPPHLSKLARPLPSEVDLDALISETGTDSSTFLAALHENYILSCFDPAGNGEATLNHIDSCLGILADADLLSSIGVGGRGQYTGSEGVRQDEIAFQVGVRGLLFNLPYPVKRQGPLPGILSRGGTIVPGQGRSDAHRMFFPMSLKLWRRKEELLELVDLFIRRAFEGRLLSESQNGKRPAFLRLSKSTFESRGLAETTKAVGGVETWRRNNTPTKATDDLTSIHGDEKVTTSTSISIGSGHSARQEMLLERLPYLARIISSSRTTFTSGPALLRDIEQVTRFTGVGALGDDELNDDDDDDDDDDGPRATKKEGLGQGLPAFAESGFNLARDEELDVEKLVLSDDDIEDD